MKVKTIFDLSADEALDFLMQNDRYVTTEMPEYLNFDPVLAFAREHIADTSIDKCLKDINPENMSDANYDIMLNKDGRYAVRVLSLSNPFLYYLLAREICTPEHWAAILDDFKVFGSAPHIQAVGIPVIPADKENFHKATTILNWWSRFEQMAVKLSLDYRYMFVTDITNCYGTIELQTVEKALSRKGTASEVDVKTDIVRILTMLRQGRNIGLPQGSTLYDIVAEIVLGYADMLLREALERDGITEGYEILRYRDDYKVFANDKDLLERISYTLQHVLEGLNLRLNSAKTRISDSIITDSIKPDKLAYIYNTPIYNNKKQCDFDGIQKQLLFILQFGRQYPNCGQMRMLLSKLSTWIEKHIEKVAKNQKSKAKPKVEAKSGEEDAEDKKTQKRPGTIIEDIMAMSAIAAQIAAENLNSAHYALKVISQVLSTISDEQVENGKRASKDEIVTKVLNRLGSMQNSDYLKIWLQNLAVKAEYKGDYSFADGKGNGLCHLVCGADANLWNNSFLAPAYLEGFDATAVVDDAVLHNDTPVMQFKHRFSYDDSTPDEEDDLAAAGADVDIDEEKCRAEAEYRAGADVDIDEEDYLAAAGADDIDDIDEEYYGGADDVTKTAPE
ncbi:MAG: RNA-directed DNA polymerase [Bacteroidales bacterium]|nr:RNA-directed DNA polymerase [Bacteroidales bacterium]